MRKQSTKLQALQIVPAQKGKVLQRQWIGIKGVTFDFDVIWNDKAYPAGTYIKLYNRWKNTGYLHGKKGDDYYDFYVPLEQDELRIVSRDFYNIGY